MQMACCPHVSTLIGFVSSKMTDDWFETMDQGLYTGVIFLDLRKAFDVVNLDLLVTKVQMFGCSSPALLWLKSYLPDRRQCANITGTLSDSEVLRSAVPQGSVLGPVLFLHLSTTFRSYGHFAPCSDRVPSLIVPFYGQIVP